MILIRTLDRWSVPPASKLSSQDAMFAGTRVKVLAVYHYLLFTRRLKEFADGMKDESSSHPFEQVTRESGWREVSTRSA
jgi:hypothetical protein